MAEPIAQPVVMHRKWPAEGPSRVPAWIYSDPNIFEKEMRTFHFGPVWNYVGLECELPAEGGWRRSWIGTRPVVITRSAEGEINVFENRCAHRGSMLCWKNTSTAKEITCPYHHWNYDLKGNLMGLPFLRGAMGKGGMPRDFDKSQHGLNKARVTVRGGVVWATFDASTPPLEQYLGPEILKLMDRVFNGRPLRLLGHSRQLISSNWKLYWENSRDPYHATLMHTFLSTFGILRTDGDYHSVPLQEGRHEYTYSHYNAELAGQENEATQQIKSLRSDFSLNERRTVTSNRDEFGDGMMGALQIFPSMLFQQYFNCLVIRHVIPKTPTTHELAWSYFGYADDDEELQMLRMRQGNLVGPAGYVSLEDSEVLSLMQPVVSGSPDSVQVLEMGGRGTEAQDTMMTENLIRAFYDFYRKQMDL